MSRCNIEIRREGQYVSAMGHRVAEPEGGVPELQRRCLETLSRLDLPPDEIRFVDERQAPEVEAETVAETAEKGPGVEKVRPRAGQPGVAKAKARAEKGAR